MPVFEEKLISPLAIRFTQEHIKTTFQDGREVESTVPEICVLPSGCDDYDLILQAPFPNIEILRWCHKSDKEDSKHWYTLDNRRLYCLQKVAAAHWPKRVAAAVDILYADPGKVRRKLDSTTSGQSVTISPSVKAPVLTTWDWQLNLPEPADLATSWKLATRAMLAVHRDVARMSVDALVDVPKTNHSSADAASNTSEEQLNDQRWEGLETLTESTAPSTQPSPRAEVSAYDALAAQAMALIEGQLWQPERKGYVWIDEWKECYQKQLGTLRSFMESHPDKFTVKAGRGKSYRVELCEQPACMQKMPKPRPFEKKVRTTMARERPQIVPKRWTPVGAKTA